MYHLIAADAAVSAGVLKAATDYRGVRALPRDFSIELMQMGTAVITCLDRTGDSLRLQQIVKSMRLITTSSHLGL